MAEISTNLSEIPDSLLNNVFDALILELRIFCLPRMFQEKNRRRIVAEQRRFILERYFRSMKSVGQNNVMKLPVYRLLPVTSKYNLRLQFRINYSLSRKVRRIVNKERYNLRKLKRINYCIEDD